jgi:tetratricopeptide (TPR) repeat protein
MTREILASGFIVRPFGRRTLRTPGAINTEVDFDRVEAELIRPAFKEVGIHGGTTGEITRAGNIRADMFEGLAVADVVVADISMHNANVFYELGARHALRTGITMLIRCRGEDVPFDLRTDRYLEYAPDAPSNAVGALVKALRESLAVIRPDSPIFGLLPNLVPPAISHLCAVPREYQDAVRRASETTDTGQLVLLSEEAAGHTWATEGIRLAARCLFAQKSWPEALAAFEQIRTLAANDLEANLKLATVFQKQKRLADSDGAIERVLAQQQLTFAAKAEALSLMASNEKTRWLQDLGDSGAIDDSLLGYGHLVRSYELYRSGFEVDLNHYYSGLNAYALITVQLALAEEHPGWWINNHDDEMAASRALDDLTRERESLRGAVELAIRRATRVPDGPDDIWTRISRADLLFLSAPDGRDGRVVEEYRNALAGAPSFAWESVWRQFELYSRLGVFAARITALREKLSPPAAETQPATKPTRWIVFAGHRVDAPNRAQARFPSTPEAQTSAKDAILEHLRELLAQYQGAGFSALCGGANGGDILFHEACAEVGIPVWLYLAIPEKHYIERSVCHPVQVDWVRRFRAVTDRCRNRTRQLGVDAKVPPWTEDADADYVWERNNRWLLYSALAHGPQCVHLMVLWDGRMEGDGAGGTHHMVQVAREAGADIIHVRSRSVFGLD